MNPRIFAGLMLGGLFLILIAACSGSAIMIGTEKDVTSILHTGVDWGYHCVEFRNTREECHARVDKAMGAVR